MKTIVFVESPAKAKIIAKYLNGTPELTKIYGKFTVMASMGHIRDLKKKELSVDIEHGFQPQYEPIYDKQKLIAEMGKKIKESDIVLLAADFDREGEAIAWHVKEQFHIKKYKRILFNEITKDALKRAVLNAGVIDMKMVDAQQARRVLDRLVGFKLSPILWKHYKANVGGLSAGRVQSAVLKIIVEKEEDIAKFETTSYWSCEGTFSHDINEAKLYKAETICKLDNEKKIKELLSKIGKVFSVEKCNSKVKRVKPDSPFITSTLQQEAYNKMGSSVKRTMKLAQDLYENGLITYMRTDSYNMSADAVGQIRELVLKRYGVQFYEENGPAGKKGAHSQEAHECIRPTKFELNTLDTNKDITVDHVKLYELIWKRSVASRLKPAVYEELDVILVDDFLKKNNMRFVGKFKRLEFEGYLIVYGQKRDDTELKKKIEEFKNAKVICKEVLARNTWTSPPARYNESSLIKVLDTEGIGRPATYAAIMSKLYEKHYVDKLDTAGEKKEAKHFIWTPDKKTLKEKKDEVFVGQEKSKLIPSDIGTEINKFLTDNFEYIVDRKFTALMEDELDKISDGNKKYGVIMGEFWKEFNKHLSKFDKVKIKASDKIQLVNASQDISHKGTDYTVRVTRFGPVIQYPGPDGKPIYKDLKTYLKVKGIDYKDIGKEDIDFVMKLPYDYGNGYQLKSGPYSWYIQKNGKDNYRLPYKLIDKNNLGSLFKLTKSQLDEIASYVKTDKTDKTKDKDDKSVKSDKSTKSKSSVKSKSKTKSKK
jgi:DNA topoisomerase-1